MLVGNWLLGGCYEWPPIFKEMLFTLNMSFCPDLVGVSP